MEIALWICIAVYVFAVGYIAAVRLEGFARRHPGAFPGRRRVLLVVPAHRRVELEDDSACDPWYNDHTSFEELESHEKCDP